MCPFFKAYFGWLTRGTDKPLLNPPQAMQTIESILADSTSMKLLPTHCINSAGELEGFALTVPAKASGGVLPVNRTMFHGTSLYEVVCRAGNFNADVMRLQQTTDIRETMRCLMQQVSDSSSGREVCVEF